MLWYVLLLLSSPTPILKDNKINYKDLNTVLKYWGYNTPPSPPPPSPIPHPPPSPPRSPPPSLIQFGYGCPDTTASTFFPLGDCIPDGPYSFKFTCDEENNPVFTYYGGSCQIAHKVLTFDISKTEAQCVEMLFDLGYINTLISVDRDICGGSSPPPPPLPPPSLPPPLPPNPPSPPTPPHSPPLPLIYARNGTCDSDSQGQIIEFPQGECIDVGPGSYKVLCTSTGFVNFSYYIQNGCDRYWQSLSINLFESDDCASGPLYSVDDDNVVRMHEFSILNGLSSCGYLISPRTPPNPPSPPRTPPTPPPTITVHTGDCIAPSFEVFVDTCFEPKNEIGSYFGDGYAKLRCIDSGIVRIEYYFSSDCSGNPESVANFDVSSSNCVTNLVYTDADLTTKNVSLTNGLATCGFVPPSSPPSV